MNPLSALVTPPRATRRWRVPGYALLAVGLWFMGAGQPTPMGLGYGLLISTVWVLHFLSWERGRTLP